MNTQFVCFETAGEHWAVKLDYFAKAIHASSHLSYDGLPSGIQSVLYFNGKLIPVIKLSGEKKSTRPKLDNSIFLISEEFENSLFKQVALEVESDIRILSAEKILPSGMMQDAEGEKYKILDLPTLL